MSSSSTTHTVSTGGFWEILQYRVRVCVAVFSSFYQNGFKIGLSLKPCHEWWRAVLDPVPLRDGVLISVSFHSSFLLRRPPMEPLFMWFYINSPDNDVLQQLQHLPEHSGVVLRRRRSAPLVTEASAGWWTAANRCRLSSLSPGLISESNLWLFRVKKNLLVKFCCSCRFHPATINLQLSPMWRTPNPHAPLRFGGQQLTRFCTGCLRPEKSGWGAPVLWIRVASLRMQVLLRC